MSKVKAITPPELQMVALTAILPSRPLEDLSLQSRKYVTIKASIREIGIIEPLLVYPIAGSTPAQYLLIDGHLRLHMLNAMHVTETLCLITHDNETYSVDACVSALAPIQEHYMIMRAIGRGVSEDRLARVLHIDVQRIQAKRNLLEGIGAEAIELLKDKDISETALQMLRKVNATRQVHIARMMNSLCNYTKNFIRAMILTTPLEQRVLSKAEKQKGTIDPGDLAALERELDTLHRRIAQHGTSYGDSFTRLTQIRGYLNRLLDNPRVLRYLLAHFPDHLRGFHKVIEFTALDEPTAGFDAGSVVPAS